VRDVHRGPPQANGLDRLTFRIHAFAFPIWTPAIICGAIWTESARGRYWGWDPKETWAFIVWPLVPPIPAAEPPMGRAPGVFAFDLLSVALRRTWPINSS
jgi:membrane glycosyltransferase